ncbi:MAG: endo-1,4-beta-xylanase [Ignavibacteriaceae bacterium]
MPGKLVFKPYFVQKGNGPHIDPLVYAADENENVFHSNIVLSREGIEISNSEGRQKFAIHVRWNIEGFGYVYSIADNGGELYELPLNGEKVLNLNYELAVSRIRLNERRINKFRNDGWSINTEISSLHDLSKQLLNDAENSISKDRLSYNAQKALMYAHWTSDYLELSKARFDLKKNGARKNFYFGCDARAYFQMDSNLFLDKFSKLFNYATITHYLKGDFIDFEAEEGKKQFEVRQKVLNALRSKNITVAGRPLFWSHFWVTPDWLKRKNFDQLLKYVEEHVKEVVGFYKDDIAVWEVVNELHDWANELELNPEQLVQITKHACEVARSVNPKVKLLINNCKPFGDYVQMGKWHDKPAKFKQRTPHQFIKDLVSAGVDFDTIGIQVYYAYYSAADAIRNIERFKEFNKSVQLSEVGCPSAGIKLEFADPPVEDTARLPYDWHRHWDEELQGDWLEYTFTYAYSQPWIEGANWYDFVDPFSFLIKGGILRSPNGEEKSAVNRLLMLKQKWNNL